MTETSGCRPDYANVRRFASLVCACRAFHNRDQTSALTLRSGPQDRVSKGEGVHSLHPSRRRFAPPQDEGAEKYVLTLRSAAKRRVSKGEAPISDLLEIGD